MSPKRPTYESAQDRERESALARSLADVWGLPLEPLPQFYPQDYVAMKGRDVAAFVELKTSTHAVTDYAEYVLNLDKWLSGRATHEGTGLPVILVVRFLGEVDRIYRTLGTGQVKFGFLKSGRGGRDDSGDRQPVVRIPLDDFQPVNCGLRV